MDTVRKIVKSYDTIEKWGMVLLLAVMVVVIFAQVFTRYIMGNALYWSEELGKFIFVWVSWLGVSAGLRDKEHIQVKLLPEALLKKGFTKAYLINYIFIDILWFLTSLFVTYYSMFIVLDQMASGVYGASTGIPMWIAYACVPFSSAIVCLRLIGQIILNTRELFANRSNSLEGVK